MRRLVNQETPTPMKTELNSFSFIHVGNFMLGVEFYSQANGEVLASVQQPVSYFPFFIHKDPQEAC